MPTPDFMDRCQQAITDGGLKIYPWTKLTPSGTTIGQTSCFFQTAGIPPIGSYPGNALEANIIVPGVVNSLLGINQISSTNKRNLLVKVEVCNKTNAFIGNLLLGDLLVTYRGISATSALAQDLSTVGSAAGRSILPRYQDGRGVGIFADVTTQLGATPQTLTVTYTNSLGASGRVATILTVGNAPVSRSVGGTGSNPFALRLQAGDVGVRSIQTAQLSGSTGAGAFTLFLYKPLTLVAVRSHSNAFVDNWGQTRIETEANLVELLPGCCPIFLWQPHTTSVSSSALSGLIKTLAGSKGR